MVHRNILAGFFRSLQKTITNKTVLTTNAETVFKSGNSKGGHLSIKGHTIYINYYGVVHTLFDGLYRIGKVGGQNSNSAHGTTLWTLWFPFKPNSLAFLCHPFSYVLGKITSIGIGLRGG